MKNSDIYKLVVLFGILLLYSCSEKQKENLVSNANFQTNISSGENLSKVNNLAIYISVKDAESGYIYNHKRIELVQHNDNYTTEKLDLLEGTYTIDEFEVVNSLDSILYFTPRLGSNTDSLVTKSLPISFNVESGKASNIALEVIGSDKTEAKMLGSVSFTLKKVNGSK
jgi:hypothetical protein